MTTTKLECWAIKTLLNDGTERVLCNVASEQIARQIVSDLNRNPQEIAWFEKRELI